MKVDCGLSGGFWLLTFANPWAIGSLVAKQSGMGKEKEAQINLTKSQAKFI